MWSRNPFLPTLDPFRGRTRTVLNSEQLQVAGADSVFTVSSPMTPTIVRLERTTVNGQLIDP